MRLLVAVDVFPTLLGTIVGDPGREIGDVDGHLLVELDGVFDGLAGDHLLHSGCVPALVFGKHDFGKLHGIANADAAMAEGAGSFLEQWLRRRVVHVDGVLVRERELTTPSTFDPPGGCWTSKRRMSALDQSTLSGSITRPFCESLKPWRRK